MPPQAAHADIPFGAELELVASSVDHSRVSPGESLQVRIWWQPLNADPERDYSVFLHMIGTDGKPLAQDDVRYSAAELRRGRVLLQTAVWRSRGYSSWRIRAKSGCVFHGSRGASGALESARRRGSQAAQHRPGSFERRYERIQIRHRRFAGGPTLEGADFDTTMAPDTRLYVHWRLPALGGPWTETLLRDGRAVASHQLGAAPDGGHISTAMDVRGDADSLR